jgi:hypothetical protein
MTEAAAVWVGVHEIKVLEQGMEAGFSLKDIFAFVAGHLVPAIDEVTMKIPA